MFINVGRSTQSRGYYSQTILTMKGRVFLCRLVDKRQIPAGNHTVDDIARVSRIERKRDFPDPTHLKLSVARFARYLFWASQVPG